MTEERSVDEQLLDRLEDYEREDGHRLAARAIDLVTLESRAKGSRRDFVLLDIATACNVSQQSAAIRLAQAHRLVDELPNTLFRLHTKQVSVGQALAVLDETAHVATELLGAVEARVYPAVLGMTPADTRRHVKAVVVAVDHEAAERRRLAKQNDRRTWVSDRGDGRVLGGIEMSAEDGVSWHNALTELARLVFPATDERTLDQQRADLAAVLPQVLLEIHAETGRNDQGLTPVQVLQQVLGLPVDGAPERSLSQVRRRTQAVVTVPVETGLDLADNPGDLRGYGPLTADHCRELLAAAELRKACVELTTGRLVALEDTLVRAATGQVDEALLAMVARVTDVEARDEQRHDPSVGLTDFIRLRDSRCVGPNCSQPAHVCDAEHAIPHPTGPTAANNLAPVSRRCHNSKSWGGWTLTPHPDGSVTWSSPLGRSFTRPPRHLAPELSNLQMPWTRHVPTMEPQGADGDADGEAAPSVDPDDLRF